MLLLIKVIPRAKKTEFAGRMSDGTFKIRLKAVPEKGQANEALIKFLAKSLRVSKKEIEMMNGFTHPRKLLRIPDRVTFPW